MPWIFQMIKKKWLALIGKKPSDEVEVVAPF